MANLTREITTMIEMLHESEQILILEIVKRFLPDDIASPDDIAAHNAAMEEYRRGETIRHEDIDWS
ncbi:MAG: hypothetical protein FWE60_00205 [Oscillospiraceae bacterium]|jgi:antitoxin component of MazEF toxin-antitoxin module|nr:hypothetical protein [Oscillospiraceae bacterium]